MPKRSRAADSDSDEFMGSASDQEDTYRSKTKRKATAQKRNSTGKQKATNSIANAAFETENTRPHSASTHKISDQVSMRKELLKWYDGVHESRGMPWRKPYNHSFTSEERAQRAYEAASDIETVNALWKGLGYYSRAARLLEGAKKAVQDLGGRLPDNAKDMEAKIPGIGKSGNITDLDINDIEDLCTLCEPLPSTGLVTAFPMKAQRKKAREELDIVNVVEWRHQDSQDRWFLLVRRPQGGLLAGLHEFPTSANVSRTLAASAMQDIAHALLSEILENAPQPYARTAKQRRSGTVRDSSRLSTSPHESESLRIVGIRPGGDVIHIFSHIKKTYRVQWVVIEGGGEEPPSLTSARTQPSIGGTNAGMKGKRTMQGKTSKRKRAKQDADDDDNDDETTLSFPLEARWTLMKDVQDAK
ncbi:hypothetical protein PHLCEN_2v7364 [Hermanssonia centrifuga]|uniref:Adenine DNA glycosylase n=1 Tax=Hermanssonia centrifuga TaxID=98765 RepID=A0A2R6NXF6_9APHY|nr:hypothetical protein PHLCEN_2v7364 [Hermanssonia centrifuga]